MNVEVMKKDDTMELVTQVVESKISRTELMDIIVGKVKAELNEKLEEAKATRDALRPAAELISLKFVRDVIARFVPAFEVEEWQKWVKGRYVHKGWRISLDLKLPDSRMPREFLEQRKKIAQADAAVNDAESALAQLQRTKHHARMELLRFALSATPEGKKVMVAIDRLTLKLKAKLVGPTFNLLSGGL